MEGNENAKLNRKTERKDETAGLYEKYVKNMLDRRQKKTGHMHENKRIFLLLHVVEASINLLNLI